MLGLWKEAKHNIECVLHRRPFQHFGRRSRQSPWETDRCGAPPRWPEEDGPPCSTYRPGLRSSDGFGAKQTNVRSQKLLEFRRAYVSCCKSSQNMYQNVLFCIITARITVSDDKKNGYRYPFASSNSIITSACFDATAAARLPGSESGNIWIESTEGSRSLQNLAEL